MTLPGIREKLYSAEELWELSHAPGNDAWRFGCEGGAGAFHQDCNK